MDNEPIYIIDDSLEAIIADLTEIYNQSEDEQNETEEDNIEAKS